MCTYLSAAKRSCNNPFGRIILFSLASYLIGNLCAYAVIAVWRVLKLNTNIFKTDVVAEFLAGEVCLFIGVIAATYIMFRFFKEPIPTVWKGSAGRVVLGVLAGLATGLLLNTLQVRLLEHLHFYLTEQDTRFPFNRVLLLCLLVAFTEETIYRGYIFQVLERRWGTGVALVASSLIFVVAHLFNPGWASSFRNICNTITVVASGGLLYASCLILTRRIWMPIALHFCWDFFHTLLYGDDAWGITSWFNAAFDSQKVDQSSAILFFGTGVIVLVFAIRRGEWKSVSSYIPRSDGKKVLPKPSSQCVRN